MSSPLASNPGIAKISQYIRFVEEPCDLFVDPPAAKCLMQNYAAIPLVLVLCRDRGGGPAIRTGQASPMEMRKCKGFIVSYGSRTGHRSKGKSAILRSFPRLSLVRKAELVRLERIF